MACGGGVAAGTQVIISIASSRELVATPANRGRQLQLQLQLELLFASSWCKINRMEPRHHQDERWPLATNKIVTTSVNITRGFWNKSQLKSFDYNMIRLALCALCTPWRPAPRPSLLARAAPAHSHPQMHVQMRIWSCGRVTTPALRIADYRHGYARSKRRGDCRELQVPAPLWRPRAGLERGCGSVTPDPEARRVSALPTFARTMTAKMHGRILVRCANARESAGMRLCGIGTGNLEEKWSRAIGRGS